MHPRFNAVDSSHVWLLIRGYINQLCGQTPTDLRMGASVPTTKFASLPVTLKETQRKAAVNSPMQSGRFTRELEDLLAEAQPQSFVLLGISVDSYDAVIKVTAHFSGPLNNWWLKRKQPAAIPSTFDLLAAELRMKTIVMPYIQDDAINPLLNMTQCNMSYAIYTQQFNDFLRRSRQQPTADMQCVRFINGLANADLQTHAKSHRAQKGYTLTLVELQNFLNDVVTDTPRL
jgi:hypothetical protein